MKTLTTHAKLSNLIQNDVSAGRKVQCLEIDAADRASLISELRDGKTPLTKQMKAVGIDAAMPTLDGVTLRWQAPVTRTRLAEPKKA